MSFASKIIKSGSSPIYFITCKNMADWDCYYFVLSTPEKIKRLKNYSEPNFDLNDFGKILESGYGKTPSEKVLKKMKDEYGFDMDSLV
jgi:hypothetical protein